MKQVTFITGNQSKADYLAKYLGHSIAHQKVDQDELQSLDLRTIVEHKAHQAYAILGSPVLVEDVSLEFSALGRLPGAFIKFFQEELGENGLIELLQNQDRSATARCVFAYYDGEALEFFEGSIVGTITEKPAGSNGFGWDRIFIPEGYSVTRAELSDEDYEEVYLKIKPIAAVREFLDQ